MLFRLLVPRLRPYRSLLVLLVALQLVQTLASLALPTLNAGVIDEGVLRGDTGRVLGGGALMIAVTLLQAAAAAAAKEMGHPMVIAVVDESGVLKAFRRMDGAALLSVDIAQNKAYTAIAFGMPTHAWHDFIKDDAPLLHGIVHTPRLVVFGGGYPLVVDGAVVGGIGVSGGHYTQDMKVAEAGVAALGAAA